MSNITRLAELGITLPEAAAPVASYVPVVIEGNLAFVSGQLPIKDGHMIGGHLGKGVSLEDGQRAAEICALNILAQLNAALDGHLDRVARVVKLGGFVACTPDFIDQPKVINGASDFFLKVFGDAGKHARAAVGVPALPRGAAVEVEAVFALRD